MTKITTDELNKLEHKISQEQDFTAEVENMLYIIAEFCVEHNISPEEYNTLIGGK